MNLQTVENFSRKGADFCGSLLRNGYQGSTFFRGGSHSVRGKPILSVQIDSDRLENSRPSGERG